MKVDAPTALGESADVDLDVILVGGGLANALVAMRLAALRPEVRWLLIERSPRLFGGASEQTWSFHESDMDASTAWLAAIASRSWAAYDVAFPRLSRRIQTPYYSIRSGELRDRLSPLMASRTLLGAAVQRIAGDCVTLTSGRTLRARLVVDGRGFYAPPVGSLGYQKFLGLDLRLVEPHGLEVPTLMDATVEQIDGYRFVYLLPWTPDSILIEDTCYSDTSCLEQGALSAQVQAYASARGWKVAKVERREHGVLPIPLSDSEMPAASPGVLTSGVAAGRFHPTTGYSVRDAARLAEEIARAPVLGRSFADRMNAEARAEWKKRAFYRRLNNMLFLAAEPSERWRVLRRFYERDERLIARFYSSALTSWDCLSLLSGRPPVPPGAALKAFVAGAPAGRRPVARF